MNRADTKIRAQIGAAIRGARLERGLTQHEVAEAAGVAVEVFGRYERGQTAPSVYTLRALAEVLHVGTDVLLGVRRVEEPAMAPRLKRQPEMERLLRAASKVPGSELKTITAAVELMARGAGRSPARRRRRGAES